MELKDFVKTVISDVVNAIVESQKDLNGVAIVNPASKIINHVGPTKDYFFDPQNLEFDIAISASNDKGISVLSSLVGGKIDRENSEVSRVKFSIPIVYPSPYCKSLVKG